MRAELEVAPQADAGQRSAVLRLAEAGEGVALVGLVEAAGGHGGVAEREVAGCAPCLLDRRLDERPGDEGVLQAESVARFEAGADEGGVEAPRARFVEERRGGGGAFSSAPTITTGDAASRRSAFVPFVVERMTRRPRTSSSANSLGELP